MSEADTDEVFLETSVLVEFAQEGESSDCHRLYRSHDGDTITSPYVKIEFERKKTNREHIVEYFQSKIGAGDHDFSEYHPPDDEHLSRSDVEYAVDLLSALAAADDIMKAQEELSLRRTRFRRAYDVLFVRDGGNLSVFPAEPSAWILRMLSGVIGNRDDGRIIAEAIDWADSEDRETVLTKDRRDFVENESKINEVISLSSDFDQRLAIFHISEFLDDVLP